jgi:osmotically inducible protein OsmC
MEPGAAIERRARVRWEGSFRHGRGALSTQSSVLVSMPLAPDVSGDEPEGKTTPEELLAAALASSYAMALADQLELERSEPRALDVEAACTTDVVDGHRRLSGAELRIGLGMGPDPDSSVLSEAVRRAADRCAVTVALTPTVPVRLRLHLQRDDSGLGEPVDPRDDVPVAPVDAFERSSTREE